MRLFFRYIIIFLIINYKWILVESTGSSATPPPSSGGDGTSSGSGTGQSTDGSGAIHTSSGEGTGTSGEGREDAKSGGWTSGSVQDGSASLPTTDGDSGTLTGANEGKGTSGEGGDGSTQSSSGAPTSGGTGLTSAPDGSASKSPEDGGSSATPPASSGGDGTSATPGQGGTATTQAENVKKTPVKLDIKQSSETDEFDYKKEGKKVTFTAKDNYGFKVVRCKNMDDHTWVDIWKTDNENEYSKKVVLEGDNKLTIHIGEGDSAPTKVFNKVGYCKWKEDTSSIKKGSDTGTKTAVDLSLKKTSGTNEFCYNKAGQVVTFTAKDSIGFSSVKTGDIVVWSTDKPSEYANKVVLNGKGKKQKEVTIHLPNNTTKVYKRDGKDKPWIDVSQQSNQETGQPGSGTAESGAIS